MKIRTLIWKDELVEKIVDKHGVAPEEVHAAVRDARSVIRRIRGERYALLGQADDGRMLFVVLDRDDEQGGFVVVTARDMTEREKRVFRR